MERCLLHSTLLNLKPENKMPRDLIRRLREHNTSIRNSESGGALFRMVEKVYKEVVAILVEEDQHPPTLVQVAPAT